MKIISFLFILTSLIFSKEHIIIKLENPQKFELIDLKQVNLNNIDDEEPLFDSSIERVKDHLYVEYDDTKKDFIILAAYDDKIVLENKDDIIKQSFEKMIANILNERSLELLNQQNNVLYQHPINFKNISKDKEYKIFDISSLLIYEPSLERTFLKIPEYLIFLAFDDMKLVDEEFLFFKYKILNIKLRFKILDTKQKTIIKDQILNLDLSFKQNKYKEMIDEIARSLSIFLRDEAKALK